VADDYPNFSICGIPHHVSGEVPDWHDLAHRSEPELRDAGLRLRLGERAIAIDTARRPWSPGAGDESRTVPYDRLVIGTGAAPRTAAYDHKVYYPGATQISMRITADRAPGGCSAHSS
jgi:NADPH-dependent 2,4-dienoyl-CoA reductase/sulfur reductase-like enzyme